MPSQLLPISASAARTGAGEVSEIQSLINRAQTLSQSVDWWNAAILWALAFAAVAAVWVGIATWRVVTQAKRLSEVQEELNLTLRKQVATLEIAAGSTAKDLLGLQKTADDAKAAQQRVQIDLDRQRELTARAQKDLLELQERVKPRHLTKEQTDELMQTLKSTPKGQLEIRTLVGNPESSNFGLELTEVFRASGWSVVFSNGTLMTPTPVGIKLWVHTDQVAGEGANMRGEAPERAVSVLKAFEFAHVAFQTQFNPDIPKGQVVLVIGFKP
jgi:hypothetical protein